MKQAQKKQSILSSFKVAFIGIGEAVKGERNMKIHLVAFLLVLVFGYLLQISFLEWCICIALSGMVIGAELFNCAIEAVVDMTMREIHPLAKKAKDTAAGAVLVMAISAAMVGAIIFIPKIVMLLFK